MVDSEGEKCDNNKSDAGRFENIMSASTAKLNNIIADEEAGKLKKKGACSFVKEVIWN